MANREATADAVATDADWARSAAIQPCMNTVAAASAEGCGLGGRGFVVVVVAARVVGVEVGATEVVVVGMAFGVCDEVQAAANAAVMHSAAPRDGRDIGEMVGVAFLVFRANRRG